MVDRSEKVVFAIGGRFESSAKAHCMVSGGRRKRFSEVALYWRRVVFPSRRAALLEGYGMTCSVSVFVFDSSMLSLRDGGWGWRI